MSYTTIDTALAAQRNLFERMADTILEKKGYTKPYTAPDNLKYKYKYTWSVVWRPGYTAACTIYSDARIGSVNGDLAYIYSINSNTLLSLNNSDGVNKVTGYTYKKDHYYKGEGMDNQAICDKYYAADSVVTDIPSFATQEDLIAYLTENDEFPPKPNPVIGPDGNEYKYIVEQTFSADGGKYRFYSKYPFCASKQQISSTGYDLLTAGKATSGSVDSLYQIHTNQGSKVCNLYNIASGAVTDATAIAEYYNTSTNAWEVCPYNWTAWGNMSELVYVNIPIFDTNAEALTYCLTATYINGQNIPNEIRALKGISPVEKTYNNLTDYLTDIGQILLPNEDRSGNYLGPDSNYYKYFITFVAASGGTGTYKIYSNYRFCTSKEYTVSSGNMYLLSGAKGTGGINNTVFTDISTNLGTKSCGYSNRISGQSISETPIISGTYNNGTFPYQWAINMSESEAIAANIPVFNTNQEALEYLDQADPPAYINAQDFPQAISEIVPIT